MKKILLIVLLQVCVFLGYAQEKVTNQSQIIVTPMGKPTDPCPTCPVSYQWNRDTDGDGFGNPAQSTFSDTQPPGYVANQADLNDNDFYITDITPHTVYRDADGDTFGTSAVTALASTTRPGYVSNTSDCNDADASINPNTVWYRDVDSDGYGTSATTAVSCTQPGGYVRNALDCNDDDASLNPYTVWYRDNDADGYGNAGITTSSCTQLGGYVRNALDCNDGDASLTPYTVWYRDNDADGYGNGGITTSSCTQPGGYVRNALDCNDGDASLNPYTVWYRDNDADGYGNAGITTSSCTQPGGYVRNALDCNDGDASLTPNTVWYRDNDADGYGNAGITTSSCTQPGGYVRNALDCNDGDASLTPNTVWYRDADGDGYGNGGITAVSCTQPGGYVRNALDCNDGDASLTPNTVWYRDADGDGYGNGGITTSSCTQPGGYVRNALDCNDSDSSLNPNTVWYRDADGDGFGLSTTTVAQCTQPAGYVRNASDYNDGTGNITNIAPQTFYKDADGDTFGNPGISVYYSIQPATYVTNNTDCNDSDATLNPNTTWYQDSDGDTFGKTSITTKSCSKPTGYVRISGDYDDTTGNITNIAPQTFYKDADGDTFGNPGISVYYSVQPATYVTNNTDCNDADATLNPNTTWYQDNDGDTFGKTSVTTKSCSKPTGYVRISGDYDDTTGNITNIAPQTFYKDADGDTFGNPGISVYYSVQPATYVTNNTDCNDADATLNPNTTWYQDNDGDTFGKTSVTTKSCSKPTGYVRISGDYDDTTGNITNIAPQTFYKDADGDTFGNPGISVYYSIKPATYVSNNTDCNDADVTLNPNTIWYRDVDADGFGISTLTTNSCTQPQGYVRNASDCNDADATLNPNTIWYQDVDGDAFGKTSVTTNSCTKPIGYVRISGDYDDTTGNITNIAPSTFYMDVDGDTFGNPSVSIYYSVKPTGYVTNNTDCNDADVTLNPNTKWYADNDLDGLGDPLSFIQQCTAPTGNYIRDNTDNCPLLQGTSSDCSSVANPSLDHNYVITKTYKQATATLFVSPTADKAQTNITYFDGLGRPMQQIANKQSSSGKDIITNISYDDFGRQVQEYLPYAATSTNMAYETNAAVNTVAFYNTAKYENTANPFSQKLLEASPLSRVIKQAAPGTSWVMDSGHEIKLGYQTNTASEVKLYQVTTTWTAGSGLYEIAFSDAGNYVANELDKIITYDENTSANPVESSGSTVEFKNKEGQVVLKRTYDGGVKHDTYYVYDIYRNLTYVLPPKAEGAISQQILDDLCYQYKYDYRNRLVEKKLPGKQWEFIVYDKLDRPVATGPAFSPFKDDTAVGWIITKYDAYSRPIYTGWSSQAVSSAARNTLQTAQNALTGVLYETKQTSGTIDGIAAYYSNAIAPTSFKLLTVNYYDNYTFPNAQTAPSTIESQPVLANVKTLATGSWTRAVSTAASLAGETNTTFYDAKARQIRTYTQNHLGGYTYTDSSLDFSGKTLYTISKHKRTSGDTEITVKEVFTYSPQDRLLTHTHQINGGAIQLMADHTYDELGQLMSRNVGNSTGAPLQKVDFSYNIRGWLTEINKTANLQQGADPKDLFAFKLSYNAPQAAIAGVTALYNGNISETLWKTGSDATDRGYGYKYDNLNRLKNAVYEKSGLTTNAYDENLTYDKNGNIMSLVRKGDIDPQVGIIEIDNLAYTYPANSNQLGKVTDNANNTSGFNDVNKTGDDYTYDANGNMITDKNKNITAIVYNQLNLPKKITFGTTGSIEYIYNAAGQKLEKIVTEGAVVTNTNYLGGFQYKNNVLEFFPTAEGYVKNTSGALSYVFQYKDHLGNIRLSYAKNTSTQVLEIIEENNYYPFGLKHKGYNDYVANTNKYKFQGQELQDELGLNWDSFKYRNYDMVIGRFMSIDPLSEEYNEWSPYVFSGNRVIDAIELEGLEPYRLFGSEKDAAGNWAEIYNYKSIMENREYNSTIGKSVDANGKIWYSYGPPNVGDEHSSTSSPAPQGTTPVAFVHSHAAWSPGPAWSDGYNNNEFSSNDMWNAVNDNLNAYASTPNGSLLKYSPLTRMSSIIRTNITYDPYDPDNPNLFSLLKIRKNRDIIGPVVAISTTTVIPSKPKKPTSKTPTPAPKPKPKPKPKPDKKPTGRSGFGFT
jgi:RHS repeat-associated protein